MASRQLWQKQDRHNKPQERSIPRPTEDAALGRIERSNDLGSRLRITRRGQRHQG
jgi:hypothetical protein